MNCWTSFAASAGGPILYLTFVRLFDYGGTNRDEEKSIRRRAAGGSAATLINLSLSYILLKHSQESPLVLMGFRIPGLLPSIIFPFAITTTLFLGSTALEISNGSFRLYLRSAYWRENLRNWQFMRNCVIAPVTEELAFRACVVPLLYPCLSRGWIILLCPLPFSLAHFHHIWERWPRVGFISALLQSTFQAAYTYAFGVYATYLFILTGHAAAPIAAHVYCNFMGFPPLEEIFQYPKTSTRLLFFAMYCIGVLFFAIGLTVSAYSTLYRNKLL